MFVFILSCGPGGSRTRVLNLFYLVYYNHVPFINVGVNGAMDSLSSQVTQILSRLG
jgi:hypothetical protein